MKKQDNKLEIVINGENGEEKFLFDNKSDIKIESRGYDLYITEPGFDKNTEKWILGFVSRQIYLPEFIERNVRRCSGLNPCSRIYEDSQKRKKLYTHFD